MKDLTTTYKILIFLSAIILVNILFLVFKSSTIGGDTLLGGAVSLHKYVLKNYNNFHLFNNGTSYNRSSTNSFLRLFTGDGDNSTQLNLEVANSTKPGLVNISGRTFESFCKLPTADGINGCTAQFKGYYDKYIEKCSAVISTSNQPLCGCFPKTLVGWERQVVSIPVPNLNKFKLDAQALGIEPGGHWRPRDCEPRQRVAIVVPYRKRPEHLTIFLHRLHTFLQRQQHEYQIFIIEQNAPVVFSRASLMNIGFLEANKSGGFDCYIFTDVDLLPEDDRNMYSCYFSPLHLGAYVSKFKYKVAYETIFGGISALSHKHVEETNLFSNRFFGWGGEDDDLFHRLVSAGLPMNRYPRDIGRVYMIVHKRDSTNRGNPIGGDGTKHYQREVYLNDGVKQTRYEVVKKELLPLMTLVTVNILPTAPQENCLIKKGVNGSQDEYLNCWGDQHFKTGKIDCCKSSAQDSSPVCCHKMGPKVKMPKKDIRIINKS